MTCPACGDDATRVIYMGAPMSICVATDCHTLWGFWSFMPVLFPLSDGEHFAFFAYSGGYLPALWNWLRGAA